MAKKHIGLVVALTLLIAVFATPILARDWHDVNFNNRPLYAYPLPGNRDDIIGSLTTYRIQKGDTLLDVGRWFGLSAKEISDANGHMDWWLPPVGREVVLPTEHILPDTPHSGIILNVPEMRLYYYFPSPAYMKHKKGKLTAASYGGSPRVVYTFPVGLGRFDWKTPLGAWRVTAKIKNPTWTMPEDIYQEHLERDGEADRFVPAGPDNPLGAYKLDLSIPQYGLHGTNVPWGIGMTVSHGCVRLYPEDIERLFSKTPVGTPGEFTYQPVKFGWRGDALYTEVHDDLYGKYPGLWRVATGEVQKQNLDGKVDMAKLEKAVETRSGIPTYVGFGPEPANGAIPDLNGTGDSSIPDTASAGSTTTPDSSSLPPSVEAPAPSDNAPGADSAPPPNMPPTTSFAPSAETAPPATMASPPNFAPANNFAPSAAVAPSNNFAPVTAPEPSNSAGPTMTDITDKPSAPSADQPPLRARDTITSTANVKDTSTVTGGSSAPAPMFPGGSELPSSIVSGPDSDSPGNDWERSR
jgi:L,D-transpeptidase ErfK/SrfK